MKKKFAYLLIIAALLGAAAVGTHLYQEQNVETRKSLAIRFTGNVRAKVLSCGCSLQDLGGMARWLNYFSKQEPETLIVDYGDFFSDPDFEDKPSKLELFEELASEASYDAINLLKSDARTVRDLSKFAFVSFHSNDAKVPKFKTFSKGEIKLWVTGISAENPYPTEELKKALEDLSPEVLPVLLSDYSMGENIKFLKDFTSRPIVIIGHNLVFGAFFKKEIGNSIYMTGGDMGRHVAVADLELIYLGKKLAGISLTNSLMMGMNKQLEDEPLGQVHLEHIRAWEKKNGPIVEQ